MSYSVVLFESVCRFGKVFVLLSIVGTLVLALQDASRRPLQCFQACFPADYVASREIQTPSLLPSKAAARRWVPASHDLEN